MSKESKYGKRQSFGLFVSEPVDYHLAGFVPSKRESAFQYDMQGHLKPAGISDRDVNARQRYKDVNQALRSVRRYGRLPGCL